MRESPASGRDAQSFMLQQTSLELDEYLWASWKFSRLAFVSAPVGFGKSAFAVRMLAGVQTLWISDMHALEDELVPANLEGCGAVVVDNLHDAEDEGIDVGQTLSSAFETYPEVRFVLLSRAPMPGWLTPYFASGKLIVVTRDDLFFTKTDISHFLLDNGLTPDPHTVDRLKEITKGYPLALCLAANYMKQGMSADDALERRIRQDVMSYFEAEFLRRFDTNTQQVLLLSSLFDEVDNDMIQAIFPADVATHMIDALHRKTDFVTPSEHGWRLIPNYRTFATWELNRRSGGIELTQTIDRIIDYFESQGDYESALEFCYRGRLFDRVRSLLEAHAMTNPCNGSYYDLEKYYRGLPEEIVSTSPLLIRMMSMLDSMTMDIEGSERWYQKLAAFSKDRSKDAEERKRARAYLAYLDLALPHRRIDNIAGAFASLARAATLHDPSLAPTPTSGLPSVLNGARDFSAWTPNSEMLCRTLRPALQAFLGPDAAGCIDIVLAECRFEQGDPAPALLARLGRIYPKIARTCSLSLRFAAVGLMSRMLIDEGDAKGALSQLEGLRRDLLSAKGAEAERILANLEALRCRIWLHQGRSAYVEDWIQKNEPGSLDRLRYMDRYIYITLAQAYISETRLHDALLLMDALYEYTEASGHTINGIYLDVLEAIALRRLQDEEWTTHLRQALIASQKYRYVRTISVWGAAVLPLLVEYRALDSDPELDRWIATLITQTRMRSSHYPDYLARPAEAIDPLTESEMQVLRLLCQNKSNSEICELLGIKLPTVKTHVSHILAKLGVGRRSQAADRAAELHLV